MIMVNGWKHFSFNSTVIYCYIIHDAIRRKKRWKSYERWSWYRFIKFYWKVLLFVFCQTASMQGYWMVKLWQTWLIKLLHFLWFQSIMWHDHQQHHFWFETNCSVLNNCHSFIHKIASNLNLIKIII